MLSMGYALTAIGLVVAGFGMGGLFVLWLVKDNIPPPRW